MRNKRKSLRLLAKELGVSHSYLSQIKNVKRPASAKVVSNLGQKITLYVIIQSHLPSCVVVARGTLDPLAQVRILARQPVS